MVQKLIKASQKTTLFQRACSSNFKMCSNISPTYSENIIGWNMLYGLVCMLTISTESTQYVYHMTMMCIDGIQTANSWLYVQFPSSKIRCVGTKKKHVSYFKNRAFHNGIINQVCICSSLFAKKTTPIVIHLSC